MMKFTRWILFGVSFLPQLVLAQSGLPAIIVDAAEGGGETWSLSLQALVLMTTLTLLPAMLLLMTSFTRITIVLGILRTAMGTAQTPSNQVLIGLALFLTLFIMRPVLIEVHETAVKPFIAETMDAETAIQVAAEPFRKFMLMQTRENDLKLFLDISNANTPEDTDDVSYWVLLPAFVTSELKTAFQIGFMLFIPFLIIDLVVASVLMSMGMMMLSPLIISLPFKLMLFVLVDGWNLVLGTLAGSFFVS
ncbi:flagellar type III secretion system pore protein FliP [Granulosicoccus sp.]|nr:flagellar type III secretion system pore protein FliP [Granulosicoccus sp.]MDB4224383.1 flagellar type III secretion system pore protein FliP [Granulosicoccus sp.]